MSEGKSRFRIKNGEIEIEYEGPLKEVNERYKSAFEWLTSQERRKRGRVEKGEEKKKEERRGGLRKPIYPEKIRGLIENGFFTPKKSLDDVIKALESKGMPTRGKRTSIRNALVRGIRKKDTKLKGTKENSNWYFWVD